MLCDEQRRLLLAGYAIAALANAARKRDTHNTLTHAVSTDQLMNVAEQRFRGLWQGNAK